MSKTATHGDEGSTYAHGAFDADALAAAKDGRTVSVCIPARNEAATIGPIVRTIVTELMARPVIDLLFPALSMVRQPLAGETAAPRWVLEKCTLADGYAVELALLIDVASYFGVETIAQVDLGVRVHRNRPLSELRPQATDILAAALARSPLLSGI